MLYCKKNVRFGKIKDTHLYIFDKLLRVSELMIGTGPKELWITSANDSKHRQRSAHYKNRALDIRTRNLSTNEFRLLCVNLNKTNIFELILFEWREKVNGRWVKHKAIIEDVGCYVEFENYLNCKNEKVSHLHVEW